MSKTEDPKHCIICGRSLGVGFFYTCRVCAATFCYVHAPSKCDHRRGQDLGTA